MLGEKIRFLTKFFLVILCFLSFQAHAYNTHETPPKQVLPSLKIKQLDGKIFDLAAEKDKLVVIMFWANWCANCKREMPKLDESYQKYKDRGLSVITISTDSNRQKSKVEAIASKFSLPSAIAADAIESSFALPNKVPVYLLIAKDGRFLGEIFMEDNFEKRAFEKILERNL